MKSNYGFIYAKNGEMKAVHSPVRFVGDKIVKVRKSSKTHTNGKIPASVGFSVNLGIMPQMP
jgi:hypothetical protein